MGILMVEVVGDVEALGFGGFGLRRMSCVGGLLEDGAGDGDGWKVGISNRKSKLTGLVPYHCGALCDGLSCKYLVSQLDCGHCVLSFHFIVTVIVFLRPASLESSFFTHRRSCVNSVKPMPSSKALLLAPCVSPLPSPLHLCFPRPF